MCLEACILQTKFIPLPGIQRLPVKLQVESHLQPMAFSTLHNELLPSALTVPNSHSYLPFLFSVSVSRLTFLGLESVL
jgi:hypothetical protein